MNFGARFAYAFHWRAALTFLNFKPVRYGMRSMPWIPISLIVPPCLPSSNYHDGRVPQLSGCCAVKEI